MTTIVEDVKLDFSDVLLMPKRSTLDSRSKVDITRTFKFKHSPVEYTGVPIIAANMDTIGTLEMATSFKPYGMAVALHKFYEEIAMVGHFINKQKNPHTFYTIGTNDEDYNKFCRVQQLCIEHGTPVQYLCIDIANGYSRQLVKRVEQVRREHPGIVIMAGNVVTGDMVYDLLERGADIVKVGIGPGSVCTTRRITGVGYPQLSAVLECQDAAHGADGLICSDGGIVVPGDLSKAFAAGSDFVMCGGIFAGHKECAGEIVGLTRNLKNLAWPPTQPRDEMMLVTNMDTQVQHVVEIKKWSKFIDNFNANPEMQLPEEFSWAVDTEVPSGAKMRYYGMSSHEAMDKHYGGKANYRASEGKVVEVPYKGEIAGTIEEMLGGLRSACTYIGARRIKDLPKCSTFVKVNRQLNDSLSSFNVS